METQGEVHLDRGTANLVILQLIGNLSVMEFAVSAGREATVKNGAEARIRLLPQTQNRQKLGKK